MIGDAAKSQKFAARMLEKGVYVIGFFYPVVPHGTARIRTQVSAAHSREDLEFAVNAFAEVNEEGSNGKDASRLWIGDASREHAGFGNRAETIFFLVAVAPVFTKRLRNMFRRSRGTRIAQHRGFTRAATHQVSANTLARGGTCSRL